MLKDVEDVEIESKRTCFNCCHAFNRQCSMAMTVERYIDGVWEQLQLVSPANLNGMFSVLAKNCGAYVLLDENSFISIDRVL